MIRVIVVDDEELIREHLQRIIDWNSMGFDIVGSASDGEEAMTLIEQLNPDLVITDIKMTFMDGIELISTAKQKFKNLNFIIVSIHDDFSFAKKTMDLGAFSYILKPIIKQDLIDTLERFRVYFDEKEAGTELKKPQLNQSKNNSIAKAIAYINENYQRSDLNLKEVAGHASINTTYLSELFKQEVGQTFTQYLTGLRIQKAKELMLHSSLMIYEISYMVGYDNPTYFSSIFKKTTGIAPSDFCQKK